jgi:tetratricopeptide (TPR) repeat protein
MCRAALGWTSVVLLGLAVILVQTPGPTGGRAAEPPPSPAPPADRKQRLRERDRLWAEAQKLQETGKLAEAIAAAEKVLAIERSVLGASHEETADTLDLLAQLHEGRQDFAAAGKARQEALAVLRASLGGTHWRVTDARLALEDLARRSKMTPAQRQQLTQAAELNRQIVEFYQQGKYRQAIQPAQHALAIHKEALGDKHPDYATTLNNLAVLY